MEVLQTALNKYQIFLKEYNLKIKNIDSSTYRKNLKLISNVNKSIAKKIKGVNYSSQNSLSDYKIKNVDYFVNIQSQVKEKMSFYLEKILKSNNFNNIILEDSNLFFTCLASLCFLNIITNSQNLDVMKYMKKLFLI